MSYVWNISVNWAKQAPVESEGWELYGLYLWPEHLTNRYKSNEASRAETKNHLRDIYCTFFLLGYITIVPHDPIWMLFPSPTTTLKWIYSFFYTQSAYMDKTICWMTEKEKGYNA